MFRVPQRPSSGVLKTVTATSDTGHNISTATSLQLPYPVMLEGRSRTDILTGPEAAVTVFSTPDGGCSDTQNM